MEKGGDVEVDFVDEWGGVGVNFVVEGGVIVTNEKKNENRIPYICEKMGIEYTDLNGFLNEILE